jgi:hypothetical protein
MQHGDDGRRAASFGEGPGGARPSVAASEENTTGGNSELAAAREGVMLPEEIHIKTDGGPTGASQGIGCRFFRVVIGNFFQYVRPISLFCLGPVSIHYET